MVVDTSCYSHLTNDPLSSNGKIYAVTKTSDTTYTVDEDLSSIDVQFGFTYPYNIKLQSLLSPR